jgi:DNA-binding Xre family transcriptional regulator
MPIRFKLDEIMEERGLTYAQVSAMAGDMSTDTLWKIVKNRGKMIGVDVLGRLLEALEIEPNDLIEVIPGGGEK